MFTKVNMNLLEAAQRPALQNDGKKFSWKNALGGSRRNESIDRSVELSTIKSVEFNMKALKAVQWPELPCEVVDFSLQNAPNVDLTNAVERRGVFAAIDSAFENDTKDIGSFKTLCRFAVSRFWPCVNSNPRSIPTQSETY